MFAFVSLIPSVTAYSTKYFQSKVTGCSDFLERNFDETANQKSPLAQIYLSSQSNNETYTLKDMLKEPDKNKLINAMEVDV